ncbi:hypothetical protein [Streptomyces sp. S1D4-14]|uniref:hypothetical protein n=1 Tax=Streptomyces sp. S1D4-14 TaxID=2594461 RepID=UPI001165ACAC|nr:hypothetical protein [Streptomyces sp. S1D4-14]QDN64382.1 hypothetical protein FNV66_00685 [Streptomyces sp. S1D4-14]
MDKPELTIAESSAVNALLEVIGDNPLEARRFIAALSFRERTLLIAWARELERLGQQGQADYENRERSAWRAAEKPMTSYERGNLDTVVRDHLRARVTSGSDWTDVRDLVLLAAPHTDAGTKAVRDWAEGKIRDLVQSGHLSADGAEPGEYLVLSAPGQDKSGSAPAV